jgi:hypothetical protein
VISQSNLSEGKRACSPLKSRVKINSFEQPNLPECSKASEHVVVQVVEHDVSKHITELKRQANPSEEQQPLQFNR